MALESTIFSNLGLPAPANAEALDRCLAAVRAGGAVPAVTAVLDGVARVGLGRDEHERILGPARKAAERDVAVAVAQQWPFGATTVSASLALADLRRRARCSPPGASVASTGAPSDTGDVSADLDAIAGHPVVTVCAGAKAFLDLGRTLEELERIGVPVLGWRHDGSRPSTPDPRASGSRTGWRRPRRWPPSSANRAAPGRWACSLPRPSPRPTSSTRWRSTPRSTGAAARPAPPA